MLGCEPSVDLAFVRPVYILANSVFTVKALMEEGTFIHNLL